MNLALRALDAGLLPDAILRAGIRHLLRQRLAEEAAGGLDEQDRRFHEFLRRCDASPIAVHTAAANEQHYEVPTQFYQTVLGPRLKYSSGLWPAGCTSLAAAEENMLAQSVERAAISDGMDLLDLGCGWGSLTLYLAERYPHSRITALSNSRTQREHIEAQAAARGFANVRVETANAAEWQPGQTFDRVLSVEMFEHMRNHRALLRRIASWLNPEGLLFVHIFCHRHFAYEYEERDEWDWMTRYFFTGGTMPSFGLFAQFQEDLLLESSHAISGVHYSQTLEAWLSRMDANRSALTPLFEKAYPGEARRWWNRWRVFFLACSELFRFRSGSEWFVGHYTFRKRAASAPYAGE